MFARRQPVIEALDHVAEWLWYPLFRLFKIRPYAVAPSLRRHRSFRYLPLALLLAGLISIGAMVSGRSAIYRFGVEMIWVATSLVMSQSPLTEGRPHRDERQLALFRTSHFWGLLTIAVLAIVGCLYMGFALPMVDLGGQSVAGYVTGYHWWCPATAIDWVALALILMTVELNVAVLVASWALPRATADED